MAQEKKYDVFISYSRKDSAIADEICKAFDQAGITYFIDREGIGGGNEFPLELATSILNSQVFLLLGSKNSYESKYTNAEIHFAFKKKEQKSILPYILDDTPMPLEIDFILSTINWRKYQEHPINTVLVDDVLKLLGRERPTELVRKDDDIEQAKRDALLEGEFQVGELRYKASESSSGVTVCRLSNGEATEIDIPSQIQYGNYTYDVDCIGGFAFSGCKGLTSLTIPNSVTSIGNGAFSGCSGLTSITIPNSVTSIGDFAFNYCLSLTSISIPNSVTSIGKDAFWGCSGLTSITIPNSVTSIGYFAFSNCSNLTSITIPNSVTSIGYGAFEGCSGLTSIIVEKGNKMYDSRKNCNAIIETASNTLIAGCKNTKIPNSVTRIRDWAFSDCSNLISITIPNSVTSIGDRAFVACKGLTSIVVEKGNKTYDTRENCNAIIETASNTLIAGCKNTITIPNSVTGIGDYAFYACKGLTSIIIPNGVTSIGDQAFSGCDALKYVKIPKTLTDIGYDAFPEHTQVIRE